MHIFSVIVSEISGCFQTLKNMEFLVATIDDAKLSWKCVSMRLSKSSNWSCGVVDDILTENKIPVIHILTSSHNFYFLSFNCRSGYKWYMLVHIQYSDYLKSEKWSIRLLCFGECWCNFVLYIQHNLVSLQNAHIKYFQFYYFALYTLYYINEHFHFILSVGIIFLKNAFLPLCTMCAHWIKINMPTMCNVFYFTWFHCAVFQL